MDADIVVGPVVHGTEGAHMGVLELAEAELGIGLGAVAGYHLGDGPVLPVGDQHPFTEDLAFRSVRSIDTTAIVSGLVILDHGREARAAPGVGALVLATTLLSTAFGYHLVCWMRRRGWGLANAVIVGSGEAARQLANSFTNDRCYGVRLIDYISDEEPVLG